MSDWSSIQFSKYKKSRISGFFIYINIIAIKLAMPTGHIRRLLQLLP